MLTWKWLNGRFMQWIITSTAPSRVERFIVTVVAPAFISYVVGVVVLGIPTCLLIDGFGPTSVLASWLTFFWLPLAVFGLSQMGRLSILRLIPDEKQVYTVVYRPMPSTRTRRVGTHESSRYYAKRITSLPDEHRKRYPENILQVLASDLDRDDRALLQSKIDEIMQEIDRIENTKRRLRTEAMREKKNIDGIIEMLNDEARGIRSESNTWAENTTAALDSRRSA